MKATCIFLLLSLALCCYQGIAEANGAAGRGTEPACGNFNLSKGCTKIFEPICGTDDILYSNECLLCLRNLLLPYIPFLARSNAGLPFKAEDDAVRQSNSERDLLNKGTMVNDPAKEH